MQNLPEDIIIEILIHLSILDINNVAMVNHRFNKISNNSLLWYQKFNRDYNPIVWNYDTDWKKLYVNYNNLYQMDLKSCRDKFGEVPIRRLGNYKVKKNIPKIFYRYG